MTDVLVVGFGNPLAGDDAAGWRAAEALETRLRDPALRVLTCRQLTPELAEEASRAALVIFLDAGVDSPPGVVGCRRIGPGTAPAPFTHQMTPEAVMETAERLYGRRPEAVLFSVGARSFQAGAGLSSEVERALPVLLDQVCELISRTLAARRSSSPSGEPQEPEADLFSVMH